jgi:hypothetical protein
MRRTLVLLLPIALLLMAPNRLPAPIQEVPESPTPAPEQSAKPKPKKPQLRSKAAESEPKTKSEAKRSATPTLQGQTRFAGAWRGTLPFGIFGDLHLTLVVNNEGNAVTESGGVVGTVTFKATNDGRSVMWRSGAFNDISWNLTPNDDGRTGLLVVKSGFLTGNHSVTFEKAPQ